MCMATAWPDRVAMAHSDQLRHSAHPRLPARITAGTSIAAAAPMSGMIPRVVAMHAERLAEEGGSFGALLTSAGSRLSREVRACRHSRRFHFRVHAIALLGYCNSRAHNVNCVLRSLCRTHAHTDTARIHIRELVHMHTRAHQKHARTTTLHWYVHTLISTTRTRTHADIFRRRWPQRNANTQRAAAQGSQSNRRSTPAWYARFTDTHEPTSESHDHQAGPSAAAQ